MFNSTGYLFLDNSTLLRGDAFFTNANMVRLQNEYNFFAWPCIEGSRVQSNFKNSAINWIFSQFNENRSYFDDYNNASSSYEESCFCLLEYFRVFDLSKLKTPHTENWNEFLRFIHYCYSLDLFGFRNFFMHHIPHFVNYVNTNTEVDENWRMF